MAEEGCCDAPAAPFTGAGCHAGSRPGAGAAQRPDNPLREYGCAYPTAGAGPHRRRHRGAGHPVGGISGIDYDAQSGQFWLISDDRSAHAPARIYTARWSPAQQPTQPPHITGVFTLLTEQGQPFPSPANALVQTPRCPTQKPFAGTRAASACGGRARATGHAAASPFARSTAHRAMGARYSPATGLRPTLQPQRTGPRLNASLEGLAFLTTAAPPGWRWKWPGCKMAPAPPCRPLAGPCASPHWTWPRPGTAAAGLHPGRRSPRPPTALGPRGQRRERNSADGPHHLLVLERDYSAGAGFGARLYRADLRSGSNTLGVQALQTRQPHPAAKTFFSTFATLGLATVDNLRRHDLGAPLPSGERCWCWCLTTTSMPRKARSGWPWPIRPLRALHHRTAPPVLRHLLEPPNESPPSIPGAPLPGDTKRQPSDKPRQRADRRAGSGLARTLRPTSPPTPTAPPRPVPRAGCPPLRGKPPNPALHPRPGQKARPHQSPDHAKRPNRAAPACVWTACKTWPPSPASCVSSASAPKPKKSPARSHAGWRQSASCSAAPWGRCIR